MVCVEADSLRAAKKSWQNYSTIIYCNNETCLEDLDGSRMLGGSCLATLVANLIHSRCKGRQREWRAVMAATVERLEVDEHRTEWRRVLVANNNSRASQDLVKETSQREKNM